LLNGSLTLQILKNKNKVSSLTTSRDTTSTLVSPNSLSEGSQLTSSSGYYLIMQTDGNLVLYDCTPTYLFATGTTGGGNRLVMQGDGNLVIYNSSNKSIWSSGTQNQGTGPYTLNMQTDGNLVIYDSTNKALWKTSTQGKTFTCGIELCITITAASNAQVKLEYMKPSSGDFQCTLNGLSSGQNCCFTSSPTAYSSGHYLNIWNYSTSSAPIVRSVSSGDNLTYSHFYPGDLLQETTDYDAWDTCWYEFEVKETYSSYWPQKTTIDIANAFHAIDATCPKVSFTVED